MTVVRWFIALALVLTSAVCNGAEPAPKSFHGKLVFFGNSADKGLRIETASFDGTQLHTIVELPGGAFIASGRVSPDGRSLAYSVLTEPNQPGSAWIYSPQSGPKIIADDVTSIGAWSPGGEAIAGYRIGADEKFQSFTIDVATGRRQAVPVPDTDWIEDWSRDGETFLATAGSPTKSYLRPDGEEYPLRDLRVVSRAGKTLRPITTDPQGDFIWPRFSPDGRQLVYYHRDYKDGKTTESATIAAADGSAPQDVVCFSNLAPDALIRPNGPPCWLPDGKTVLWKVMVRPKQEEAEAGAFTFELIRIAADGSAIKRSAARPRAFLVGDDRLSLAAARRAKNLGEYP